MDLSTRGTSPPKELGEPNAAKVPPSSAPSGSKLSDNRSQHHPMLNRWFNESENDAPWMAVLTSDIRKASPLKYLRCKAIIEDIGACLEFGVAPSRSESRRDKPNQLLDQILAANIPPSLSDGSSHNEEGQRAAAVIDVLSSRVAQVLHIDEHTDGQEPGPAGKPQDSVTAGGNEYTEKAKGKRSNLESRELFDGQDDPRKQVSAPKRLKVAEPPTRAGGRFFACLFLKRDPNYCQNTHCAGRSTPSVETVIRHWLQKHVNQGDLDGETHKTIRDMKKKYNMSVPGQDEELWAASYMTLFHVNRKEVPSPFLTADVDDLSSVLANRLTQQPAFATELVTFFEQDAAMRHRHEEGREKIRRRYEAVEAERVEQVKSETRSESKIATQQHEDSCRLERENFKDSFRASLAADGLSTPMRDPEGAVDPQEPRGTIDDTSIDGPVLQNQPYASHQTSDVNFSDSSYGSNESYCFICCQTSFVDSNGCCVACLFQQSYE